MQMDEVSILIEKFMRLSAPRKTQVLKELEAAIDSAAINDSIDGTLREFESRPPLGQPVEIASSIQFYDDDDLDQIEQDEKDHEDIVKHGGAMNAMRARRGGL